MSKEILLVVDAVSNERGIAREVIVGAIESALAAATKKRYTDEVDIRVAIDRDTGNYETFRRWQVIDEEGGGVIENAEAQISLAAAREKRPEVQAGDFIEEPIESVAFGRIAAQTAKQVIIQKVREAERAHIVEQYQHRVGELLTGVVKRVDRGNVIIDIGGNAEALLSREDLIPRESVRPGDRVRVYLRQVRSEARGPQLHVSRTAPELLIELFRLEVPEVGERLIEIVSAARDPGSRAKIAVRPTTIVSIRSAPGRHARFGVQRFQRTAGERIDIILWDNNGPVRDQRHVPGRGGVDRVDEETGGADPPSRRNICRRRSVAVVRMCAWRVSSAAGSSTS